MFFTGAALTFQVWAGLRLRAFQEQNDELFLEALQLRSVSAMHCLALNRQRIRREIIINNLAVVVSSVTFLVCLHLFVEAHY